MNSAKYSPASSMFEQEQLHADAAARQKALDPNHSFIVDAPAGAGKTELLSQRFLVLLARVNEPEEVVALTFTRKAAAEMRDRIMASLRAATRPLSDDALPHKQKTHALALDVLKQNNLRAWQLLDQPGRLRVMTLDALSMSLVRQMPLLTRFGTQPGLSTECKPLYEEAARNTLALLESAADEADRNTVERVLAYFDNDAGRLQTMLVAMLERRDQWQRYIHVGQSQQLQSAVTHALGRLINEELSVIAAALSRVFTSDVMSAARHAASNSPESPIHLLADWDDALPADAGALPSWRAFAELFLTSENKLRKDYRSPINLAGKENKAQKQTLKDALAILDAAKLVDSLARIRELPDPQLGDAEAMIVQDLARLLHLAYGNLWLGFIQEKTVDHTEIARRALLALGEPDNPTDLAQQLDYQVRHLLVDEFQDTSPSQVALLEMLTSGWSADSGQTLFLVGDPMQSIYRFRKADVGLFIRVRQNGIGPIQPSPLQLYQNNRSVKNIVDWVNQTFASVFAEKDDATRGAVRFSPAVAHKPLLNQPSVRIHPIISGDRDPETDEKTPRYLADQQEAETIVRLIRESRSEAPDAQIAVLVRARSHLDALVDLLQAQEPRIAFQAVEIDALAARQSVQDLVALTRALHHQADRINWLAILRAPWCGLSLADLHQLAAHDHEQTIWSLMQDEPLIDRLSTDGQLRLRRVRLLISEAYKARSLQRSRRWVEGVWLALGGPQCLNTPNDAADVQAFLQLLDKLDVHGTLDLSRLDDGLGRLFAAPDASFDSQHVQLMTVHKSKGLQFDTVILPGLHKRLPSDDKALIIWDTVLLDDDHEHLVVAPVPPAGAPPTDTPSAYDLLRNLEKIRSLNEAQRVLYVAVTRAERCLHLLGVAYRDPKGETTNALKAPATSSLLAPLWPALESHFLAAAHSAERTAPANTIDSGQFVPRLIRLRNDYLIEPTTIANIPESFPSLDPSGATENHTIDMAVGTLTHRYLEAIANDGLMAWPSERISQLLPYFEQCLASDGHESITCRDAAKLVEEALLGALNSEQGRWLLGPQEEAGCEVPMSSLQPDVTQTFNHHVIDRTFISDGERWIIDYKTLRIIDSDVPADQQLESKALSYKPQLERYAALFAKEGLPIRTAIFFPTHGTLIEI
ncbi:MAG: hypothetical protein RL651_375 [Pseudomonadota bacterium]|jgi:ATP-dependent exoDNAse (exonuclease V) beta subunit